MKNYFEKENAIATFASLDNHNPSSKKGHRSFGKGKMLPKLMGASGFPVTKFSSTFIYFGALWRKDDTIQTLGKQV